MKRDRRLGGDAFHTLSNILRKDPAKCLEKFPKLFLRVK
jgi:hypothetical protein